MPETADCPRCEAPRPFDLRGYCRKCGTRIAEPAPKPGVRLDVPKTWSELWPTLVVSGGLLIIGAGLIAAGVAMLYYFRPGKKFAILCLLVGGGFVVGAIKCWLK
jgi:hypothetical protein